MGPICQSSLLFLLLLPHLATMCSVRTALSVPVGRPHHRHHPRRVRHKLLSPLRSPTQVVNHHYRDLTAGPLPVAVATSPLVEEELHERDHGASFHRPDAVPTPRAIVVALGDDVSELSTSMMAATLSASTGARGGEALDSMGGAPGLDEAAQGVVRGRLKVVAAQRQLGDGAVAMPVTMHMFAAALMHAHVHQ